MKEYFSKKYPDNISIKNCIAQISLEYKLKYGKEILLGIDFSENIFLNISIPSNSNIRWVAGCGERIEILGKIFDNKIVINDIEYDFDIGLNVICSRIESLLTD
jgi:hypothetical protein